jgi:hypothetical protein
MATEKSAHNARQPCIHTKESFMKSMAHLSCITAALGIVIASASSSAHAAVDGYGQILTLTPNADETQMALYWLPIQDDFGPATPCNLRPYTLNLYNDSTLVTTFNQNNAPLSGGIGECFLQKTIVSGAVYTNKVSPGIWTARANRTDWPQISESRTIQACTSIQGKQPMYRTRNNSITDNFYTTSISQRNTSLNVGYSDRGVPFSMPNQARFGSKPFYRYYKGAPQFEHFYTYSTPEWQYVEQNGYTYEGIEGYVFETRKPGTVALRRYALFNGATGDLQHYYTIISNDPSAAGWGNDGIVGYVCPP